MPTQLKFEFLPDADKIYYLKAKGIPLITRRVGMYRIQLHYLNSYFVEVYYNVVNYKNEHIGTFRPIKLLDPYLVEIKLVGLGFI